MYVISDKGKKFIKDQEGRSLKVYSDADGYSVGYGHFLGKTVPAFKTITQAQADTFFAADILNIETRMNKLIKRKNVPQGVIDAVGSFGFNVGTGAYFAKLAGMIEKGDMNAAKEYISLFVYSKDKNGVKSINPVLQKRRALELEFFTTVAAGVSLLFFLLLIFAIYYLTKNN
jgi:GH24 family phage-related lysozyme (muramidase)